MKFKEFNNVLRENAKFNITNKSGEIDVSNYIVFQEQKPVFNLRKLTLYFSSFVFVFLVSLFMYFNFTSVASMSIDINPTITFEINRFNRITEVKAENSDALALVEQVNFKYLNFNKAINKLYYYEQDNNLLEDNSMYMLIGVYGANESENERISKSLNLENDNIKTIMISFTETKELAIATAASQNYDYSASTGGDLQTEVPEYNTEIIDSSGDDFLELANYYNISRTKLMIIISIIEQKDGYIESDEISQYVDYDIKTLYDLYMGN